MVYQSTSFDMNFMEVKDNVINTRSFLRLQNLLAMLCYEKEGAPPPSFAAADTETACRGGIGGE